MGTEFALSLEKVFEGRIFRVPDYQRGCAWEARQLDDLLEDLDLLERDHDHYTGTVVLHPRGEAGMDRHGKNYVAVDVVDGQQRLTTLVILLDAVRRQLLSLGLDDLAHGVEATYLRGSRINGEPLHRLRLGADSDHYWTDVVLSDSPSNIPPEILAHKRLKAAQDHFQAYLGTAQSKLGAGYTDYLVDLFDKIAHRLKVIPYEVSDAADVGVIFEVMNDRGRPLSELEKVKNYLLYVATRISEPDGLSTNINQAWSSLLRRLMQAGLGKSADEDQLLRAHWYMAYNPAPREWDGVKSIKSRLGLRDHRGRLHELLASVHEYVSSLEAASAAYAGIQVPSRPDAFLTGQFDVRTRRSIVEASERLRRQRVVATFLPVLMAARLREPGNAHGYLRLVDACEKFAFRTYRLAGARSDAGYSQLCRFAFDLFHGVRDVDETTERIMGTATYYVSNDRFHELLEADRNWYQWTGIRYMLYEYEYELARNQPVRVSWDLLASRDLERSVEHILPQTPTDRYWTSHFGAQERTRWTNDIGNLVLTQDNSTYGNKPFPAKRGRPNIEDASGHLARCYSNSALYQEKELAQHADWTPIEAQERRDRILSWARRRWHVEPSSPLQELPPGDETELSEI